MFGHCINLKLSAPATYRSLAPDDWPFAAPWSVRLAPENRWRSALERDPKRFQTYWTRSCDKTKT